MLPNIKKPKDIKIKKIQTVITLLDFAKKNIAGTVNKEMQIKLKE